MTELAAASHGILDQPGTVAFLVIFGMGVILFFVFRSMAKHLKKIQMAARAEAEAAARARPGKGADTGAGTGANTMSGPDAHAVDEQRRAGYR
ncbi:MAG: hypothetical protein LBV34_15420 [Nocardiopsaceae bacterium]|nr:hypothetical protein [Nocardiopsaceae bacterium]